jgi:hypothetical protein
MFRRSLLAAISSSAAIPTVHTQVPMSSDDPLDDIELVEHDHDWIDRQLRNHYGAAWHEPPLSGIFHHKSDNVWRVPDSRTALLQRAGVLTDLPEPDYGAEAYDCEDYAFRLYTALTMAYPRLSVGIAFNFSGDHVFNVFVTADGEVIEYEPQDGEVVTDSEHAYYEFENGILFL